MTETVLYLMHAPMDNVFSRLKMNSGICNTTATLFSLASVQEGYRFDNLRKRKKKKETKKEGEEIPMFG